MLDIWWLAVGVFVSSFLLTWLVRHAASGLGTIDRPNERSSHSNPTPRGGGLAIVLTSALGILILLWWGVLDSRLALALLGGWLPIAFVGFMDDCGSLPVSMRLACHVAAAVWAIYFLGGLPPLEIGAHVVDMGLLGDVLGVLAVIWTLNLFNFMDGIDGIAASEAIFICWGGAFLTLMLGEGLAVPTVALLVGAACCGFLLWNWPPARIFMGDVGSGCLGFVIAILAVAAARESAIALVVWLILGGVFFTDATITLVRRIIRGERPYQAHRMHAYQWLARRWGGHLPVTLMIAVVNVLFLFPCAFLATMYTDLAWWILFTVLVPLGIVVAVAGAGRSETKLSLEEESH